MAERTDVATRMRQEPIIERSTDEIRQDIAARRETITETVDKLGERIHETLDWKQYVADHPLVALGLAAGVGFLVAGFFKRQRQPSPGERIYDAVAETIEDVTDRLRDRLDDVTERKGGVGRTAKAAAVAMVTKAATDFLKGRVTQAMAGKPQSGRQDVSAGEASELRPNF
jgi:ElaB/YqjD/DUF883 family membrane-anchored ribosome-binding protein